MKRSLIALAVVLALFTACLFGGAQEGEELVGGVVETDTVLGGGLRHEYRTASSNDTVRLPVHGLRYPG